MEDKKEAKCVDFRKKLLCVYLHTRKNKKKKKIRRRYGQRIPGEAKEAEVPMISGKVIAVSHLGPSSVSLASTKDFRGQTGTDAFWLCKKFKIIHPDLLFSLFWSVMAMVAEIVHRQCLSLTTSLADKGSDIYPPSTTRMYIHTLT